MARVKGGYINLIEVNTEREGGKAKQQFGFAEAMMVLGYSIAF
jgi:hypothetical protein